MFKDAKRKAITTETTKLRTASITLYATCYLPYCCYSILILREKVFRFPAICGCCCSGNRDCRETVRLIIWLTTMKIANLTCTCLFYVLTWMDGMHNFLHDDGNDRDACSLYWLMTAVECTIVRLSRVESLEIIFSHGLPYPSHIVWCGTTQERFQVKCTTIIFNIFP